VLNRRFVTYDDLIEVGVPKYSRKQIIELMRAGHFPPAVQLTPGRIAWCEQAIIDWLDTRPPAYTLVAELPPGSKRIGRPRGSRVVLGADGKRHVVLPGQEAEAATEPGPPARKRRERL
jgi:hypothetical protein